MDKGRRKRIKEDMRTCGIDKHILLGMVQGKVRVTDPICVGSRRRYIFVVYLMYFHIIWRSSRFVSSNLSNTYRYLQRNEVNV